jgi:dolichol-phosphate mannosyltransferase
MKINQPQPNCKPEMPLLFVLHPEDRAAKIFPRHAAEGWVEMPGVPEVYPSVLLLIPAYNEEGRIEPVLRGYAEFFRRNYRGKFQLVVVLNGCRDNTLGVVRRVAAEFPEVSSLDFPAPIGKGGALIEGLRLAPRADLIGYVDADGATAPPALLDLIRHADEADCVIGSRWVPGAVLHQMQTGRRQFASRVFHLIVQFLFRMNIRDTQCGAKVMRRAAVEKIHPSLCIADMAFDINLALPPEKARRLPRVGGADRVDRQGGIQSGARPHFADDAIVGRAVALDLLAAGPLEEDLHPFGTPSLPQTQRPAAES